MKFNIQRILWYPAESSRQNEIQPIRKGLFWRILHSHPPAGPFVFCTRTCHSPNAENVRRFALNGFAVPLANTVCQVICRQFHVWVHQIGATNATNRDCGVDTVTAVNRYDAGPIYYTTSRWMWLLTILMAYQMASNDGWCVCCSNECLQCPLVQQQIFDPLTLNCMCWLHIVHGMMHCDYVDSSRWNRASDETSNQLTSSDSQHFSMDEITKIQIDERNYSQIYWSTECGSTYQFLMN